MCVILHMSVITQDGWSALMYVGSTEVVVELVKAGANLNLQSTVCQYIIKEIHDVHVYKILYMYSHASMTYVYLHIALLAY